VGGGETVFQACSGCHVIGDGESNGIGPDLRKVVGRNVAAMVGFRYSPAMKNLGGKWTRDPPRPVPDQSAGLRARHEDAFPRVADPQKRKEFD